MMHLRNFSLSFETQTMFHGSRILHLSSSSLTALCSQLHSHSSCCPTSSSQTKRKRFLSRSFPSRSIHTKFSTRPEVAMLRHDMTGHFTAGCFLFIIILIISVPFPLFPSIVILVQLLVELARHFVQLLVSCAVT